MTTPYASLTTTDGAYSFGAAPLGKCYIGAWESEEAWNENPLAPAGGIAIDVADGSAVIDADIIWGQIAPLPVTLPSGTGKIEGTLVDADRGSPVSGSAVVLWEGGLSTTTDSTGYFSFENIPAGYYTVILTKDGYGGSKAQAVKVLDGETTTLELIQMPCVANIWSFFSPIITVSGVSDGDVIDVTRDVGIAVSGDNDIKYLYVRIGNKHASPVISAENQTKATLSLIPASLPPGSTYIYISAYDVNNNRAELTIDINPESGQAVSAPASAPLNVTPNAYTYGERFEVYSARVNQLKEEGLLPSGFDPYKITMSDGQIIDLSNLPADSTCFMYVGWDAVTGAEGYRVYRASSAAGTYSFVGDVAKEYFYDADPAAIYPGRTFYYKVSAYNGGGEGSLSDASAGVTVLDVFRLNLSSPANNLTGVSTTPTLGWSINSAVGDLREYQAIIWENNKPSSYVNYPTDSTVSDSSVSVTVPLKQNEGYHWDVWSEAYGSEDPASPGTYLARSRPSWVYIQGIGIRAPASNNGTFTFTTAP